EPEQLVVVSVHAVDVVSEVHVDVDESAAGKLSPQLLVPEFDELLGPLESLFHRDNSSRPAPAGAGHTPVASNPQASPVRIRSPCRTSSSSETRFARLSSATRCRSRSPTRSCTWSTR